MVLNTHWSLPEYCGSVALMFTIQGKFYTGFSTAFLFKPAGAAYAWRKKLYKLKMGVIIEYCILTPKHFYIPLFLSLHEGPVAGL